VYGEWIDAIDAQEKKKKASQPASSKRSAAHDDDGSDSLTGGYTAKEKRRPAFLNREETEDEEEESDEDEVGPDEEELSEGDLVDYREIPDQKKHKALAKETGKTANLTKKSRTADSDSEEDDSGNDALFGSSSESEANYTE